MRRGQPRTAAFTMPPSTIPNNADGDGFGHVTPATGPPPGRHSSPVSVPVLDPKASASMPRF